MATCPNGCIKQESKQLFNERQRKLQEVAWHVVSPKALCCVNLRECLPDLLHFSCSEVKLRLLLINFLR